MEPKDPSSFQPKIIYIRMDQPENPEIDPEMMKWLASFVERMGAESFTFENFNAIEPSELDELEYIDSTVQGDDHPEALKMIMDAYYKHQED